jgi:hypothetical protein
MISLYTQHITFRDVQFSPAVCAMLSRLYEREWDGHYQGPERALIPYGIHIQPLLGIVVGCAIVGLAPAMIAPHWRSDWAAMTAARDSTWSNAPREERHARQGRSFPGHDSDVAKLRKEGRGGGGAHNPGGAAPNVYIFAYKMSCQWQTTGSFIRPLLAEQQRHVSCVGAGSWHDHY